MEELVYIRVQEKDESGIRFINLKYVVSFVINEDNTSSIQLLNNSNILINGNFQNILNEFITNLDVPQK